MGWARARLLGVPALAVPLLAFGTPDEAQRLVLPVNVPEAFEVAVRIDGAFETLQLERHSVRAPGFVVRVHGVDGRPVETTAPPAATYRGTIAGRTDAVVVADLAPAGLNARIFIDDGPDWTIRALAGGDRSTGATLHEVFAGYDGAAACATSDGAGTWCGNLDEPGDPAAARAAADPTGVDGQHLAEIAFDLDFPFYEANGSSVENTIAAAEAQLNLVDFTYASHVQITYALTHVIVRTAPFYPSGGGALLDAFIDEWNTNQVAVPRDLAHLLTDAGGPAGIAASFVVCNLEEAYGYSSGPPEVLAHELGHNWSSLHCHDYVPCNITCSNCLDFGPKLQRRIEAFRDSIDCLDLVGPHPDPLPPDAEPDAAVLTRDEIASGSATRVLDVLANDLDGNFDTLAIDTFDAQSVQGGTIMLSPGTGNDGADELIYEAPGAVFAGNDRFTYTVGDMTGQQTVGDVALQVAAPGLVGYWALDGNLLDASGGERHGNLQGSEMYSAGVHGQALVLNGSSYASAPGLRRDMASMTIAAWLRREGNQLPFACIAGGNGVNGLSTLNFGNANELRYQWADDDPAASGWDPGLVVPDEQWVFAALVVEPHQATIYLHDGVTLQSAVNPIEHRPQDIEGAVYMGWEPTHVSQYMIGMLDDVRIYDHALTTAEITALHDLGGRAFAPSPPDGGAMRPGSRKLSWSAGPGAVSHDVYFGSGFEGVRDADTSSSEFLGNTTETDRTAPPPLFDGGTYFWRVDEVTGAGTVAGHVWAFSVRSPLAHWTLDDTSGTTAAEAVGGLDGTYLGQPLLDQGPAQPELGRSVDFDGIDDAVEIPPLNLDTNEVTFTLWVRRDGPQEEGAGILVTRSASTVAGLEVGAGGAVYYKWRDIGVIINSEFDVTGLQLPDGAWALLALVVSPEATTIYVGSQGSLSRYDSFLPNDREEFDGPLHVARDPGPETYFRGRLDDVRIFPFAMDAAQVQTLLVAGRAAGHVPASLEAPGSPLTMDRLPGGELSLAWSPSCLPTDSDYSVYAGNLGDFAGHLPVTCSTGGATSTTVMPVPGNRYYLVVPRSVNREGGYGTNGTGQPRPHSPAACRIRFAAACP